ncbi:MAG: phosphate/phosphite/phosphonate ABC transporter substrate-binding protein, partial [Paracoccaceae bacterium]
MAETEAQSARLGVLAYRGTDAARAYWQPLAAYLTAAVEGWRFEIVPVTLVSAPGKLAAKQIDFLITNPGHFVALAEEYPLSALATRERLLPGGATGLLSYGTVIFARRDKGMQTLGDLAGKSLAAVSPDAFGGFQLAWSEMMHQNIDPFADLGPLRFMGFPQDAIVAAVAAGRVDAGVVRSGLLESLDAEGRIDIEDFEILNSRAQPGYPFRVTGRLHPEWPFLVSAGVGKALREKVSLALLRTQDPGVVRAFGLGDAWSAPLPYADVRRLVSAYHSRGQTATAPSRWPVEAALAAAFA